LLSLAVRGPAPGSREPGSASGACFADPRFPWSPPFAPSPPPPENRSCSATSQLLWRSQTSPDRARRYGSSPSRRGPSTPKGLWPIRRSPGSHTKSLRACQVLRPCRVAQALALALLEILPSATQTASAPGISFLSRLNGWPARSPTDASPTSSRMPAHGSGPMWLSGRGADYSAPPPQIPACGFPAPGSCRRCDVARHWSWSFVASPAWTRRLAASVTC
jgi:hypothetical protein